MITPILALLLLNNGFPDDAASIPAQFIGRYEGEARDCRIPPKSRNDDEASKGSQGGTSVLLDRHSIHFAQWDWPVRAVNLSTKDAASVELVNDVNADGKKIEMVQYEFKLDGKVLTITDGQGSAQYYRCNTGS